MPSASMSTAISNPPSHKKRGLQSTNSNLNLLPVSALPSAWAHPSLPRAHPWRPPPERPIQAQVRPLATYDLIWYLAGCH